MARPGAGGGGMLRVPRAGLILTIVGLLAFAVWGISPSSLPAAARSLESHPAVAFAQPNWIYTLDETSNDPYYTNDSLWGMYGDATSPANQYGSQAGEAWAAGYTGSGDV